MYRFKHTNLVMTISMSIFREGYSSHAARPEAEKNNMEYRKKSRAFILIHSKVGRHKVT